MIFQLSRPGLDLQHHHDDDNELLFQEQKSCRARARKFSLETNRRRKALEERRRQWDVQEQLLRENILQQRKQRLLEDTERFQRAHLPPSQKRRPGQLIIPSRLVTLGPASCRRPSFQWRTLNRPVYRSAFNYCCTAQNNFSVPV
uniref:Uncharacterized protein n=1 Tax=Electrophorus electricus TaxID=8005 RepID=A0AAY5E9V1_ELEEL